MGAVGERCGLGEGESEGRDPSAIGGKWRRALSLRLPGSAVARTDPVRVAQRSRSRRSGRAVAGVQSDQPDCTGERAQAQATAYSAGVKAHPGG
jgi:hypothetical protein